MLTKEQKKQLVEDLSRKFNSSKAVIFTDYHGLKVNDLQNLRKRLKEKEAIYQVIKTTLLKIALDNNGLKIDQSVLNKPLAIAYSQKDEIDPIKILSSYSKENKNLEILGGLVNKEYLDTIQIKTLANLPSREILYTKIVGSIKSPLSGLVNILSGNLRGLVSVLNQYREKIS